MILLEVHGLELFGYHGVLDEEKRNGQTFLFDLELEVSDAALSDRIDEAVDYREIVERVRAVSDGRRFDLIEALAGAVADELVRALPAERVRVRVRKRPADLPVAETAATVVRP
jgi:dihydroneopterin aldolase